MIWNVDYVVQKKKDFQILAHNQLQKSTITKQTTRERFSVWTVWTKNILYRDGLPKFLN